MTLYRLNRRLSQELFIMISCFEVALRNAIDRECRKMLGNDWLKDSIVENGIFSSDRFQVTATCITEALRKNVQHQSHAKLIASLGFGFWRYFFASSHYNATHRCLLNIFPCRPPSSKLYQFNPKFIYNQLAQINHLRNRIAHHEPICFRSGYPVKSSLYAREKYEILSRLFEWMAIDSPSFLYGLDHILISCDKIDFL